MEKLNGTIIYGVSDDLVEFKGEFNGEYDCYGSKSANRGILLVCSDGTILEAKYGRGDMGIWGISILAKGSLFSKIEICTDEEAVIYSDIVYLAPGIKWVYAAQPDGWESVQ